MKTMNDNEPMLTKSIQDVLKGSFWETFSEDRDFISAVHHYYAVVQKYYSKPFYEEALAKLVSESERVQRGQAVGNEKTTLVPATMLLGVISKAAVNERETTITFPDGKTGDTLYADYVARNYYESGAKQREKLKTTHNTHPEDCFFR